MDESDRRLSAGARNLLINCAGLGANDRVLIVRESAADGYYDEAVPRILACEAECLGAHIQTFDAEVIDGPEDFPQILIGAMERADHTIFCSRIGDVMRFIRMPGKGTVTMCYALDPNYLAADFSQVPYQLQKAVRARLQTALNQAREWRVTCALGSDVVGTSDPVIYARDTDHDFSLRLFPIGTFRPFPCDSMNGRLVTRWLPPAVTHRYQPYGIVLDEPVAAIIEKGRIVTFEGKSASAARAHYEKVGAALDTDPFIVDSWHGGINPKVFYSGAAEDNIERWAGVMWGSPRYTHFHSCGDYSPGEVLLSIIDPTIEIDGKTYWKDGRFIFLEWDDVRSMLDDFPGFGQAFEPRLDVGL